MTRLDSLFIWKICDLQIWQVYSVNGNVMIPLCVYSACHILTFLLNDLVWCAWVVIRIWGVSLFLNWTLLVYLIYVGKRWAMWGMGSWTSYSFYHWREAVWTPSVGKVREINSNLIINWSHVFLVKMYSLIRMFSSLIFLKRELDEFL